MMFEILDGAFMFLRRRPCFKCAQIPALTGLRIFLPGIQPVLTRFKLSDHIVTYVAG